MSTFFSGEDPSWPAIFSRRFSLKSSVNIELSIQYIPPIHYFIYRISYIINFLMLAQVRGQLFNSKDGRQDKWNLATLSFTKYISISHHQAFVGQWLCGYEISPEAEGLPVWFPRLPTFWLIALDKLQTIMYPCSPSSINWYQRHMAGWGWAGLLISNIAGKCNIYYLRYI